MGQYFDLESISNVSVSYYSGTVDTLCNSWRAFDLIAPRVQTSANFVYVEGIDHGVNVVRGDKFFWSLVGELTTEMPSEMTVRHLDPYSEDDYIDATVRSNEADAISTGAPPIDLSLIHI